MSLKEDRFSSCLYFASNTLARKLTKMGEQAFSGLGMSPSYAFLLLVVINRPGVQPSEISNELELAPSTVTRHIEKLEREGLIERHSQGRATNVQPTEKGKALRDQLESAWNELQQGYSELLGDRYTEVLTEMTYKAAAKL
ncbi:MAG: MarR family transcriptional regulator [Balneolaceae bacterium]|nr:MarR family transcriptional regulator [Balneolaceae bacterium]